MLFQELKTRGLIKQSTDPKLESLLNSKPISLYIGFDPSSDSLHVGNLLPITLLKRFQEAGHTPIALTGSATGMIGDPSGKSAERNLLDSNTLAKNTQGVQATLKRFLNTNGKNKAVFLDNSSWMSKFSYLDFLRDVGKHFTVNHMIAKDSVKSRLEDRESGISYTEFSYMLIQAYDFYYLNLHHDCTLQAGGSDQWGNITAGCELIRRIHAAKNQTPKTEPFGLTSPLITKADGSKYGKSEKGAIWLDPNKTSPYEFYQFFVQTSDEDVMKLLRFFTFLSLDEIDSLHAELKKDPEKRIPQKALAKAMTGWAHGPEETKKAETSANAFFQKSITELKPEEIKNVFGDAPSTRLSKSTLKNGILLVDLLIQTKMSPSKGAARREIIGGGISINQIKVSDPSLMLSTDDALHAEFILIRKGKKNYHLVYFS